MINSELKSIFFVTSHGFAGDPYLKWIIKVLNSGKDMFAFYGESTRSKYFKGYSRKERPDPKAYKSFLRDACFCFKYAGEIYGYRSYQLKGVTDNDPHASTINIVTDPLIWLYYYVTWRMNFCHQPGGLENKAMAHEWNVVEHDLYKDLKPYKKEDVKIWATYRGITILGKMGTDHEDDVTNMRAEDVLETDDGLTDLLAHITDGDREVVEEIAALWPPEKRPLKERVTRDQAFDFFGSEIGGPWNKLLSEEQNSTFSKHGYEIPF